MLQSRWRAVAFLLVAGLALAWAASALAPRQYVATGGVLVPAGMMKVRYESADPRAAATLVQGFIESHKEALLVDPPLVTSDRAEPRRQHGARRDRGPASQPVPVRPPPAPGALRGRAHQCARRAAARRAAARAAAPLAPAPRALVRARTPRPRRGQPAGWGTAARDVAAELARAFAQSGEPTLLIDADFRAPALHRAFGLRNRAGLADFLEGRGTQIAHCAENLSVLVAGRSGADPLELLSRGRMLELLAAAATRYRVILVHTPAAARGPDLQLFAAFAGGALVVAKRGSEAASLTRLRDLLALCKARVVGTVLSPT